MAATGTMLQQLLQVVDGKKAAGSAAGSDVPHQYEQESVAAGLCKKGGQSGQSGQSGQGDMWIKSDPDWSQKVITSKASSVCTNAFVRMLHLAWTKNLEVEITPDTVWLIVCQGVATYLKENLVAEEKQKLQVVRDDFAVDVNLNDWGGVVDDFHDLIGDVVGAEMVGMLVPDKSWSGSDATARLCYRVGLMDAMSGLFAYEVCTRGGGRLAQKVRAYRVLGSLDDWERLVQLTEKFSLHFGELAAWFAELVPVMKKFCHIVEHCGGTSADVGVLQDFFICDNHGSVSGDVLKLFPYMRKRGVKDDSDLVFMYERNGTGTRKTSVTKEIQCGGKMKKTEQSMSNGNARLFPSGVSVVPFMWMHCNIARQLLFEAHAFPTQQSDGSVSLQNVVCVRAADAGKRAQETGKGVAVKRQRTADAGGGKKFC
jgi:hypothetical protein